MIKFANLKYTHSQYKYAGTSSGAKQYFQFIVLQYEYMLVECVKKYIKFDVFQRLLRKLRLFINISLASGPCRTKRRLRVTSIIAVRKGLFSRRESLYNNICTPLWISWCFFTLSCSYHSPYLSVSSRLRKSHRYRSRRRSKGNHFFFVTRCVPLLRTHKYYWLNWTAARTFYRYLPRHIHMCFDRPRVVFFCSRIPVLRYTTIL